MLDKFYAIVKFPEEINVAYHITSLQEAETEIVKWKEVTGYSDLKIVEVTQKIINQ